MEYRNYDIHWFTSQPYSSRLQKPSDDNEVWRAQHTSHSKTSRAQNRTQRRFSYMRETRARVRERRAICARERCSSGGPTASAISRKRSSRCIRGKDYARIWPLLLPFPLKIRIATPKIILDHRAVFSKFSKTRDISLAFFFFGFFSFLVVICRIYDSTRSYENIIDEPAGLHKEET